MQSKLHSEAIELYSCAVALSENNAVYYCNRCVSAVYIFPICLFSIYYVLLREKSFLNLEFYSIFIIGH